MKTRVLDPWVDHLPQSPDWAASKLTDLVTCLENHRPAFIRLAEFSAESAFHANAVIELRNLEHELQTLRAAFGMENNAVSENGGGRRCVKGR